MSVTVIRTGAANLASVQAAFRRIGVDVITTESPAEVASAERLVLPGVGAFGPAIRRLRSLGLCEPLVERIRAGRPTLAICLGLQLLAAGSAEDPTETGLSILPVQATRFEHTPRVPQMGWNHIETTGDCRILTNGYAYFANSFKLAAVAEGWNAAYADYGERFIAAFERGAVVACQFHPELSSRFGRELLERWLAAAREARAC